MTYLKEEDLSVLNNLRKRLHGEEGFTLIELLVVILIIGILAAIAIPSFLNQKGKGEDTVAKTSAQSIQTALETYYTDNSSYDCTTTSAVTINGTTYTAGCDSALHNIEATLPRIAATGATASSLSSTTPALVTPANSGADYSLTVESLPSGRTFTIAKTGGQITRTCTVPTGQNNGACKNPSSTTAGW